MEYNIVVSIETESVKLFDQRMRLHIASVAYFINAKPFAFNYFYKLYALSNSIEHALFEMKPNSRRQFSERSSLQFKFTT